MIRPGDQVKPGSDLKTGTGVAGAGSRLSGVIPPLVSVLLAAAVSAVILLLVGENPIHIGSVMLTGSLGSLRALANTLEEATPLIFTGLCVAVALRCGLFNIGGEGQLVVGAFAAAWAGVKLTGLDPVAHVTLCVLLAGLAGALWALIAGILKARFGAHEVINTIMLNYIAFIVTNYLVTTAYFKKPGQIPQTYDILPGSALPRLSFIYQYTRLNLGFVLAIVAVILVYVILEKTRLGFELKSVGLNPTASRASGISVVRNMVIAMAIAGFLAGMAGSERVLGVHRYFISPFPFGYGFAGIAVALLGRNHPIGVLGAAIFFGALASGGAQVDMETSVPRELVTVIQAIVIIFVACEYLVRKMGMLRRISIRRMPGMGGREVETHE
jgi:simple sugar transport system permease protein